MARADDAVTCHWLTPTRIMPNSYGFGADVKPWSCLRDGCPRSLDTSELRQCPTCPRWELRTFEATKRDLVFETWGVGIPIPAHEKFDDVRRDLVLEAWEVG
jgi:hypothetical protein